MTISDKKQWQSLLAKARRGNADAQYEVGYYYEEGLEDSSGNIIVKPNPKQAMYWYTLSAQQGDPSSQLALSNILHTGEQVEQDIKAAIRWAKLAIGQNCSSAAHNLGTIYRDLNKPTLAFRWYKRAVEMGDLDSLLQVGLCYFFGYGTKKNPKSCYKCLTQIIESEQPSKLCERTVEDANYWLGIFHLVGTGGAKKSSARARGHLESANKDSDHEQANALLNLIGKSKYLKKV